MNDKQKRSATRAGYMYGIDRYNVVDDEIFVRRGVAKFALSGLIRESDRISDSHIAAVKERMYEAGLRNVISQKVGCANEVAGLVTRYLGAENGRIKKKRSAEYNEITENGNSVKMAQFAAVQRAICEMATRRYVHAQRRGGLIMEIDDMYMRRGKAVCSERFDHGDR
jgi:hypothetical protein